MSNVIAVIALVVSVVSIIVQARQNQRQSQRSEQLQERLTVVEEGRRRDERQPKLTLQFVPDPEDYDGWLQWVNRGSFDLDEVYFTLIERSGAGWQPLRGVRFIQEGMTLTDGSLGPMKIGEPVAHGLVRTPGSEDRGGTARFRMRCVAGADTWEFPLDCEVPGL